MDDAAGANHMFKRDMDDGAIAGTVVGVVVAAILVIFCLYPVIVHRLKRRHRNARLHLDAEAGHPERPGSRPGADVGSHRRHSSSDSLKRDGDISHSHDSTTRGKELELPPRNEGPGHPGVDATSREVTSDPGAVTSDRSIDVGFGEYDIQTPPFAYPYGIEYMPESEVQDDKTGVLKGTSADYYSPSIPSEAFGMVTTPTDLHIDTSLPRPSGSRSSSLRYNVRHMFRRKSGRDNTIDSYNTTSSPGGVTALQQIVTNEDPTESPTEVTSEAVLPEPGQRSSPADLPASQPPPPSTPPLAQAAERSFKHSSPPSHPAPGTVNPMDIMPASTESEVWYRRDQQMLASSHQSSSSSPPIEQDHGADYTQTVTSPSPTDTTQPPFGHRVESPTPSNSASKPPYEENGGQDILMPDRDSHEYLSLSTIPESNNRHPSYPSDQSTPFPGHGSSDASSHNTPSTQLDSPSPASMNSSDYRHSVSPQPIAPLLKPGEFRCSEVGCNQVFDQPHKLKHHQRYHSKDHKCHYPNCGKGFGTKTHLQRHINDRHEKKKKFHCSVQGCEFSKAGGRAFPRKDNWKRHMTKIHSMDQTQLPEPIEVDQETS